MSRQKCAWAQHNKVPYMFFIAADTCTPPPTDIQCSISNTLCYVLLCILPSEVLTVCIYVKFL
eukprot:8220-Heterococcus_DN1.PRE.1